MAKSILLSVSAALLAALAAWIVTVNVYTTVKAFEHKPAAPALAFRWGFGIAGVAGVVIFTLTLYALAIRRRSKDQRRATGRHLS